MNGKDLMLAPFGKGWPDAAAGVMLRVTVLLALLALALFGRNSSSQASTWATDLDTNWSNANTGVVSVTPNSSSPVFIGAPQPMIPSDPTFDVDATVNNPQFFTTGAINFDQGKTPMVNGGASLSGAIHCGVSAEIVHAQ